VENAIKSPKKPAYVKTPSDSPPAGYSWINAIEMPKPVAFNDLITTMNHRVMETKR